MSVLDKIVAFGVGVYEETLTVPAQIVLPLAAHDKLMNECAARLAQEPHTVPGTISCIQVETGHGVIKVVAAAPRPFTPFMPMPRQSEGKP